MTVYIPVPITEEFPPDSWKGIVFCEDGGEYTAVFTKTLYAKPKFSSFTNLNNSTITHWLKKVELPESSNLEVQQIQDSYIKGYEAGEREWISVEDRLPKSGEYVDVFAIKTYESGATKGRRYTEIEYYIDPVSKWADFIMPIQGLKITHWRYLPDPP